MLSIDQRCKNTCNSHFMSERVNWDSLRLGRALAMGSCKMMSHVVSRRSVRSISLFSGVFSGTCNISQYLCNAIICDIIWLKPTG